MKSKIFALIALMLCFGMFLVSCGAENNEEQNNAPACTAAVDENADGICDNCGHAYFFPGVEDDAMAIKPIPVGVPVSDYFNYEYGPDSTVASKYKPLHGTIIESGSDASEGIVVLTYTQGVEEKDVPKEQWKEQKDYFTVYDIVEDKVLHNFTSENYSVDADHPKDTYSFFCEQYFFIEHKKLTDTHEVNGQPVETTVDSFRFFTNAGEPIGTFDNQGSYRSVEVGNICYLYVGDKVFPIDMETGARVRLVGSNELVEGDADIFIKRPAFDKVIGSYGYVFEKNHKNDFVGVQIYDLTKWLECVYSYDIPDYVNSEQTFVASLADGRVFVQTFVPCHLNDEVYDVSLEGGKYDIVYTVIDFVNETETEVGFGYVVKSISNGDEMMYATEAAINTAQIIPIFDGLIDAANALTVVIDNDLNILLALEKDLPGQKDYEKIPVGDGLFVIKLRIGTDDIMAVVDEAGEFVTYLPEMFVPCEHFIIAGDSIYGYDMTEKFGLYTSGKYNVEEVFANFVILSKVNVTDETKNDYFYYNTTLRAPELIATDNSNKQFAGRLGNKLFMIEEINFVDGSTTTSQFVIYSADNRRLASFSVEPDFVGEYEGKTLINVDGTFYVFE